MVGSIMKFKNILIRIYINLPILSLNDMVMMSLITFLCIEEPFVLGMLCCCCVAVVLLLCSKNLLSRKVNAVRIETYDWLHRLKCYRRVSCEFIGDPLN